MADPLNAISIAPKNGEKPTRLLAVLHGWGANAQDLASLAPFLNLPGCQMVFPDAPFSHPQGGPYRAWYALEREDRLGLSDSVQQVGDWLQNLTRSMEIPLSNTVLAGFSQGGAMTLDVGLRLPLAGLCCLSGYLHPNIPARDNPPPVAIAHGREDLVVPLDAARQTREMLTALGVSVDYREFDGGHEIPPEIILFLQSFVEEKSAIGEKAE